MAEVKVYVSGISGNKEVKKRQQRVQMILDSRCIKYEAIDIAEPGNETEKDFMQGNATMFGSTGGTGETQPKYPLPPQIFNGKTYCGDYDAFDLANENDDLDRFLKVKGEENGAGHDATTNGGSRAASEPPTAVDDQAAPAQDTQPPIQEATNGSEKTQDAGDDKEEEANDEKKEEES